MVPCYAFFAEQYAKLGYRQKTQRLKYVKMEQVAMSWAIGHN
jgi:hypothetical protein